MSDSTLLKEGIYWPYFDLHFKERKLSGCNWGIRKKDLLSVNGFDEDYQRPGVGEDHDIEWRLKSKGLHMKSVKNRAIVYHLYHPKNSTKDDARFNNSLMEQKKKANQIECANGLLNLKP
jgi:GT2 family glycosyltransferase